MNSNSFDVHHSPIYEDNKKKPKRKKDRTTTMNGVNNSSDSNSSSNHPGKTVDFPLNGRRAVDDEQQAAATSSSTCSDRSSMSPPPHSGRQGSPDARQGSSNARPGSPDARPESPDARQGSPTSAEEETPVSCFLTSSSSNFNPASSNEHNNPYQNDVVYGDANAITSHNQAQRSYPFIFTQQQPFYFAVSEKLRKLKQKKERKESRKDKNVVSSFHTSQRSEDEEYNVDEVLESLGEISTKAKTHDSKQQAKVSRKKSNNGQAKSSKANSSDDEEGRKAVDVAVSLAAYKAVHTSVGLTADEKTADVPQSASRTADQSGELTSSKSTENLSSFTKVQTKKRWKKKPNFSDDNGNNDYHHHNNNQDYNQHNHDYNHHNHDYSHHNHDYNHYHQSQRFQHPFQSDGGGGGNHHFSHTRGQHQETAFEKQQAPTSSKGSPEQQPAAAAAAPPSAPAEPRKQKSSLDLAADFPPLSPDDVVAAIVDPAVEPSRDIPGAATDPSLSAAIVPVWPVIKSGSSSDSRSREAAFTKSSDPPTVIDSGVFSPAESSSSSSRDDGDVASSSGELGGPPDVTNHLASSAKPSLPDVAVQTAPNLDPRLQRTPNRSPNSSIIPSNSNNSTSQQQQQLPSLPDVAAQAPLTATGSSGENTPSSQDLDSNDHQNIDSHAFNSAQGFDGQDHQALHNTTSFAFNSAQGFDSHNHQDFHNQALDSGSRDLSSRNSTASSFLDSNVEIVYTEEDYNSSRRDPPPVVIFGNKSEQDWMTSNDAMMPGIEFGFELNENLLQTTSNSLPPDMVDKAIVGCGGSSSSLAYPPFQPLHLSYPFAHVHHGQLCAFHPVTALHGGHLVPQHPGAAAAMHGGLVYPYGQPYAKLMHQGSDFSALPQAGQAVEQPSCDQVSYEQISVNQPSYEQASVSQPSCDLDSCQALQEEEGRRGSSSNNANYVQIINTVGNRWQMLEKEMGSNSQSVVYYQTEDGSSSRSADQMH